VKATKAIPAGKRDSSSHQRKLRNQHRLENAFIYYEMTPEDFSEIRFCSKDSGRSQTSLAYIPTSEDVIKGTLKFVLDCVRKGLENLPPYTRSGNGGRRTLPPRWPRKPFCGSPGKKNPDPAAADLGGEDSEAVNATGIGSMGMGGKPRLWRSTWNSAELTLPRCPWWWPSVLGRPAGCGENPFERDF
jgi:tartrate dehydratase alpha subunit/fumarate hydratase class I-like protein